MIIKIIAIGTRMPHWVNEGYQEYAKRLPSDYQLKLIEIPAEKRRKNSNLIQLAKKEGQQLLSAVSANDYCIALERTGKSIDTKTLANHLEKWHFDNQNICVLIGGPEGLAPECLSRADTAWSLSALTMPHPLVRVILSEQIYRAWSILGNHPYHR